MHRYWAKNLARADALLFGRVTYEMMEAGWRPRAGEIDAAKNYVVSSALDRVDWNAELLRGDHLGETIQQLKQQSGKGLSVGGVKLLAAVGGDGMMGLIDEYEFVMQPRLVGHGPTLLRGYRSMST